MDNDDDDIDDRDLTSSHELWNVKYFKPISVTFCNSGDLKYSGIPRGTRYSDILVILSGIPRGTWYSAIFFSRSPALHCWIPLN